LRQSELRSYEERSQGRTKSAMHVKIAYDAEILKYAGYMITA